MYYVYAITTSSENVSAGELEVALNRVIKNRAVVCRDIYKRGPPVLLSRDDLIRANKLSIGDLVVSKGASLSSSRGSPALWTPPKLDYSDGAEPQEAIHKPASEAGHDHSAWTVELGRQFL